MTRHLPSACTALLIAAALAASPAAAQEDAPAARALAHKGSSLYDLGKYPEALEAFEAAYEKKPVPGLLFNIAQCHRQMGHLEQAARVYRSYLRTDPPEGAARQARDLLAKVEEALNQAKSAAQAPPQDLSRPQAPPAAVAASIKQPAPAPAPESNHWPAIVAGGAAAGALALAIAWGLGSKTATDELAQLHQAGAVDPARDAALRHDATSGYNRSKAGYAVAAVSAAAGLALWFAF